MAEFEILSTIGKGAYSEVFKVRRLTDGLQYALKKVRMQRLSFREKENALNEVRILASIEHECIIGYKEAFFDDSSNHLCIVMEHADGGDILGQIKNKNAKKDHY